MKKIILTSLLALSVMFGSSVYAEENQSPLCQKCPSLEKKMPKLYDKDGNELKAPPKFGEKVYDKNGKELPPMFMHKMPKGPDLNLTEEQKQKADKIREASRHKLKPIRREIHELKNQIWEIQEDETVGMEQKKEKLEPLFKKIRELRSQADKIRQEDMKQFESLLTKEQKKTLEKFKKTHKPQNPNGNFEKHKPPFEN